MKFTSRAIENVIRTSLVIILILLMVLPREPIIPLVDHLLPNTGARIVAGLVEWVIIFWLMFGKRLTPKKPKNS
jgi:hypothetical protein